MISMLLKLLPMWPEPARAIMYKVLMRHNAANNAVFSTALTGSERTRSNSL
jgi:hypothetical protein